MKLPKVNVKTEFVRLRGGLDLESPAIALDPGALIVGMNYVCGTEGGYERIDGYERFSGQPAPSDGTYYYCPCTFTAGGPSVADTVEGVSSGETGEVITVGSDYINVTKLSDDFDEDEVFKVGSTAKGTFTAAQVEKGETTALLHATALNLTADVYRADIAEPTSSGPVRGVVMLDGTLYCFIDNGAGNAGLIYKSTASGWSAVTPGNEISFEAGTGLISEGDVITGGTSGAKATVARVVLESGAWGGAGENYVAASLNVVSGGGTIIDGDVENTWVDDADPLQIEEEAGAAPCLDFDFTFAGLPMSTFVDKVHLNGYYDGSGAHDVFIYMWNYYTFAWVRLTAAAQDFPNAAADDDYTFNVPVVDRENYFNFGAAKVRINHASNGISGHDFYLDYLRMYTDSSAAVGRLIIGAVTVSTFQNPENLTVSGVEAATTSLVTAITITAGGRYETVVYNFTGSTDTKRIYGCNGKDRGFEFDGTTYVPIDTGMTSDAPEYVSAYKYQLFFSFKGSSQNSSLGKPYQWTPITGASEIALGDDVVGYSAEAQGLIICSRNSTHQLLGDSTANFFLDLISDETGAIPHTIQSVGKSYALDDRGLIEFSRVQEYGNFDMATISRKIQPRVNDMRSVVVASSVYRSKNQYRLYGSNGSGICVTMGIGRYGIDYYFTQFSYPDNVACAWSGEDANGKDVVFFGSDAGMVYQADKGSSFDGQDIEAYAFLPYNNSKSPSVIKSYRFATFEMTVEKYAAIQFNVMFSYGNSEIQPHLVKEFEIQGDAGLWDVDNWGSFFFDSEIVSAPRFTIAGDGTNMSLSIYSKSDIDLGHKIDGLIIHYTPRRVIR